MSLTFGPKYLEVSTSITAADITVTDRNGIPALLTEDVTVDSSQRVSFTVETSGTYRIVVKRREFSDEYVEHIHLSDGPDYDPSDIRSVVDYLLSRPSGGGPTDGVTQEELESASTADRNRLNHTGFQAISTVTNLESRLSGVEAAAGSAVTQEELTTSSTADRNRSNHTGSQPISTVTNLETRLSSVETVAADAVTTSELDTASTADRNRANHTGTQAISTVTNLETRLSDAETRVTQAELTTASTTDRNRANHTGTQAISTVTNLESRLSGAETDADTAVAAISRTGVRAVGQGEQAINAMDHGAVGNGITDDRAAINAALTAAATSGTNKVLLPKGDYLISSGSILIPEGVSLIGEGMGVSRIINSGTVATMVNMAGSIGSTLTTLTANANVGASTLTVTSTVGISAGDWLMLLDDRAPDQDKPTHPGGELVKVFSVDSGTSLTLVTTSPTATQSAFPGVGGTFDDTALDGIGPYLVSSNARLAPANLVEGSSLKSLSLVNLTPGTISNGVGVTAGATLNASITEVEIHGIDGAAINLGHAVGAKITGCNIHDLVDDGDNNRLGYGINIAGAASDIIVSDCTFARLRHSVTTGGHVNGGIPRRITVANCQAFQTHQASFDTHGCGLDIMYVNCLSVDSAQYGFNVRGRRVTFRGCEAVRPGSYGFNIGTIPARRVKVDSCTVTDGKSAGLRVGGDGIVDVHISNFFVDGCAGNGVLLGYGNTRQVITNSRFFNIGQGGAGPYYGITFATGTLGAVNAPNTLISGNLFIKDKTYGATTDYNAAVRIPHAALTSVAVWGTRAYGIYAGGDGFILDSGTTTVLWDNIRPGGTHGGTSGSTATTTQLNSITSLINLTKRRGMTAYNITTGKPVWASADGAAATWVDATGAVAHTPA